MNEGNRGVDHSRIVGEALVAAIGACGVVGLQLTDDIRGCRDVELAPEIARLDSAGQQARYQIAMGLDAIPCGQLNA